MSRSLAIIGGGASAVILLANLARAGAEFSHIAVYDRAGAFGRGVAYGTDCPAHRLNVRADKMSAFHDVTDDFVIFAAMQGYGAEDFAPRMVYADYLREKLSEAEKILPIRFMSADVQSATDDGWQSFLTVDGNIWAFDEAVQASGNVRALAPIVEEGVENYLPNPWDFQAVKDIATARHVGIVGSGLSAADAIVALDYAGFGGKVTVVSRNGWFPGEHAAPFKYLPFLTDAECRQAPSAVMKRVRDEIRSYPDMPWQAVIDSMRESINGIWQGWDERERGIFLRHALTLWNIHRHRMPPETAAVVGRYLNEGRLRIVKDRVLKIAAPCTMVGKCHSVEVNAVINALGYRYEEGRVFDVTHRIGPAAFGPLFETTAIPEIRAQAAEIALSLSSRA